MSTTATTNAGSIVTRSIVRFSPELPAWSHRSGREIDVDQVSVIAERRLTRRVRSGHPDAT